MSLLEIKDMTKNFGGLYAVKDVDISIDKGEIVGLIGPNGAGKTTLFRLISGFYKPTSGQVTFKGENITGLKPNEICKRGLSRTFQIVQPFHGLTVEQNVQVAAFNRYNETEQTKNKAREVLEFVDLIDKKDVRADTLTIADRKKLEVAKAYATEPEIILFDEVMSGLNPKETEETIALIQKIADQGVTIFLIEHVMRVVMTLAERITVIHHGEKLAEGTPKEIQKNEKVIEAYLGEEMDIA